MFFQTDKVGGKQVVNKEHTLPWFLVLSLLVKTYIKYQSPDSLQDGG